MNKNYIFIREGNQKNLSGYYSAFFNMPDIKSRFGTIRIWESLTNSLNVIFKKPFCKPALALVFTMFLLYGNVKAQTPVSGIVRDAAGQTVPGVTVTVKGTTKGAFTDAEGRYTISAGRAFTTADVLEFRSLGYLTVEIPYAGNNVINVVLKDDTKALNEVVVTALGIKREEKSLGYAQSTIKGEDISEAPSNNWTNALSGKVAGLNMLKSGGGPSGSNRIILRGEGSLTGTDEALIVVDGIVMGGGSRITGTGSNAYLGTESPADFGSGLSDINPDDIESVTVLKGPGATALYGARGAGGAIVITTKSGRPKAKGIGVTINSNTAMESVSRMPDYQYEYGQGLTGENYYSYNAGVDGASTRSTSSAWGRRFNADEQYFQYDPLTLTRSTVRTPWVPYTDNRSGFFETGKTFTNTVTVDGGNEKTNARVSYTNLQNTWIIPNTGYSRNSIAASISNKLTDKLQISTKVNYTNKFSDNLPSTGYNNQTIMYFINAQVPNASLDWYKDYWVPGQEGISQVGPFSSLIDNPYLIANEMLNRSNRNQVLGNVQATYNFTKDLSVMMRTAVDFSYEARSQQRPKSTEKFKEGMFRTQNIFSQELNSDFLIRYGKKVSEKFQGNVAVGGSTMRNRYLKDELRAERLNYPGVFSFANSKDVPLSYPYRSDFGVNSFYGLASFSYDDFLFLDITGRNDWSSTLATPGVDKKIGFFYPSVNLSAILSDAFKLPEAFSFVKLRGSWAQVGNSRTFTYFTSYTYRPESSFPSGLSNPTAIANPDLQSELTTSIEFGADLRLFKDRLSFDIAVYQNNTTDQIVSTPIDRSSGWSSIILNSGLVKNRGIEIEAKGTPVKSKSGFNWDIYGTFTANRNQVETIADSISTLVLQTGPGGRGSIEARPGGTMGAIYGLGYLRSPNGQIVYNEQGYPILDQNQQLLGNTTPDWKGSLGTEFRYKQLRLNVLFDSQFGAKAYSLTHSAAAEGGKLTKTLPGRYNGIIGNGVIQNADGSYRPNDVVAENIWTYYSEHYKRDNVESNLFSTDYIKLREVRFDYSFKPNILKKLKLQKATLGLYGRDLFIISNWPSYDPEFGTLNNGSITSGFEIGQFPATRSMGLNLSLGI
ncbi:SusC/RagA family TonB-linked outer membrane protein [Daejeonella oryzae]|uniref:SusC/RagA family TonB-linked outer membrane protein n=1 Tax=Daejeonella oryzae TaxID=1122943 RepID=UPI00042177AB|nr:SusC/RagA family TonB-linked outer membrane protein [Daejeonella oryzae]